MDFDSHLKDRIIKDLTDQAVSQFKVVTGQSPDPETARKLAETEWQHLCRFLTAMLTPAHNEEDLSSRHLAGIVHLRRQQLVNVLMTFGICPFRAEDVLATLTAQ